MATSNASDDIIFSVTRKHNARRRPHSSYGRGPFFTRESGNLLQVDSRRTSGYLSKSVGIGQVKPKAGQSAQFTLVMKKKRKIRKPSQLRVEATVGLGSRLAVKKQINAQTKYRCYRGDLSRMAQRRIWKIQQIRSNYKKFLAKEKKLADEDEDESNDDDAKTGGDAIVDVD